MSKYEVIINERECLQAMNEELKTFETFEEQIKFENAVEEERGWLNVSTERRISPCFVQMSDNKLLHA